MGKSIRTTQDIKIPKNPFDRVIGQEKAVKFAKICAKQKRHLLLVGVPGTGKSMLAQAIASSIPKPKQEIVLFENKANPDRPLLKILSKKDKQKSKIREPEFELYPINKFDLPILEKLGYVCRRCGEISNPDIAICPLCGYNKSGKMQNPFDDLLPTMMKRKKEEKIKIKITKNGKQEEYYVLKGDKFNLRVVKAKEYDEWLKSKIKVSKKIIIPLNRNTFVMASGASESELLGDVKHDPYGDHRELGSPAHMRVVPGAVHEAHEGVLFLDEIPSLGNLQRNLLTAMQEKKYPIVGRSSTSTGSTVKVENVPCDFVFVGACNISDVKNIMPQLRNRIVGSGYEILLNHYFEKNEVNKKKLYQFIAQEIQKDKKIPHATVDACERICEISHEFAKKIDGVSDAYSLRLRTLGGIVKMAGDFAVISKSKLIEEEHVKQAYLNSKPLEIQINEKFPTWWKRSMADAGQMSELKPDSSVS